jgi:hypothetical protein
MPAQAQQPAGFSASSVVVCPWYKVVPSVNESPLCLRFASLAVLPGHRVAGTPPGGKISPVCQVRNECPNSPHLQSALYFES